MLILRTNSTVTSKLLKNIKKKKFVDTLTLHVKGGSGGQGLPNYGGVGGRGGNVHVVGAHNATLKKIQTGKLVEGSKSKIVFKAESGENSKKFMLLGKPGKDVNIEVPPGVTVSTQGGKYLGEVLEVGDKVLVAKGGEGGYQGNNFQHTRGHHAVINLDLKLIADIGMVGFPNAGKSSLVKSLSKMNVKIKPYPFTTLHPQVGMMKYPDLRQISVADLPGLVEGAHHNYGLGHSFLKHIERTKVLLFVVDLHGFQFKVHSPHRSAFETVLILLKEMELTQEELLHKPAILALNKTDLPNSDAMLEEVTHKLHNVKDHLHEVEEAIRPSINVEFEDILGISARCNVNVSKLKDSLRHVLDDYTERTKSEETRRVTENVGERLKKQLTEHASSKRSVTLV